MKSRDVYSGEIWVIHSVCGTIHILTGYQYTKQHNKKIYSHQNIPIIYYNLSAWLVLFAMQNVGPFLCYIFDFYEYKNHGAGRCDSIIMHNNEKHAETAKGKSSIFRLCWLLLVQFN